MSRRTRIAVLVPALAGLGALLLWAFAGLPDFGHYHGPYGFELNRIVVPERHATNVVGATVFDVRGFDTLGEEFILLAAVTGVVMLLRSSGEEESKSERAEAADAPREVGSEALSLAGKLMVGVGVLVALWVVAFGYVTPGGGFQGGVLAAGAILLVYLARSRDVFRRFSREEVLDPVEAAGATAFASLGLAALVAGMPFLHNLLGHGQTGTLWSAGSIALVNWSAAIAVAAANLVLYSEFLDQYLVPLARTR